MMALAFALTGDNENRYFSVALGIALSTTVISYLFVYPALAKLRTRYPDTGEALPRPRRPGHGEVRLLARHGLDRHRHLSLLWPGFGVGWFGTKGDPEEPIAKLGFGGARMLFEVTQIVPLVILIGIGVVFWLLGRRSLEREAHAELSPAIDS